MSFIWTDDQTDQTDIAAVSFEETPTFSINESAAPWALSLAAPEGDILVDLEDLDAGVGLDEMLSLEQGSWDADGSLEAFVGAEVGDVPDHLTSLWSANTHTSRLHLTPNRDIAQSDYARAASDKMDAASALEHIHLAMRLSHKNAPLEAIRTALENNLPAPLAKKALARIAQDHGVVGRIFIQAAAFPGIKQGRWDAWLKKHCKTARYVVTPDIHIAQRLGLIATTDDLDWGLVHAEYAPRMRLAGYTLLEGPDPRAALAHAFIKGPSAREIRQPLRATAAKEAMTFQEAREILARTPAPPQEIFIRDDTRKARERVLAQIFKAHKQGFLSDEDHVRLAASTASPEMVLHTAQQVAKINLRARNHEYKGSRHAALVQEHRAAWADLDEAHVASLVMQRAHNHLLRMTQAGQITAREAAHCAKQSSPENVLRYAAAYALRARREAIPESQPHKPYEGTTFEAALTSPLPMASQGEVDASLHGRALNHVEHLASSGQITRADARRCASLPTTEQILQAAALCVRMGSKDPLPESQPHKPFEGALVQGHAAPAPTRKARKLSPLERAYKAASKASGIPIKDLHKATRTLRALMASGLAGKALTAALARAVAAPSREALSDTLTAIRKAHEGLSGHLYVDAALFASPTGTTGCEKAASTQRTNAIPFVRQMTRCSTCVFGQNGHCSVYNKNLMANLPEDAAQRRAAVLKEANTPRKRSTAASYDPGEFQLGTEMDSILIQDEHIPETLSDVTFGGLYL